MNMLLKDKTALVYGAGGAVGGAVAKAFAREGALVHLAGRTVATLEVVAQAIREKGGRAEVAVVDTFDPVAVDAHLERLVRSGPVNLMFNAVGLTGDQGKPLADMDRDNFFATINDAMKTWFHTGTAVARHMAKNGGGVILGISANAARQAYTNMGGFGVATGAVEHFLRHLAVENAAYGVRVCCIRSPGSPDAPGVREAFLAHAASQGLTLEEVIRNADAGSPLGHLTTLPEIADLAVLLASDYARSMTGTVINGTGGAQVD
jgi:7-alpha-hydroxysteroid dehydrogenase